MQNRYIKNKKKEMQLDQNEYTTSSFLEHLKEKFGKKTTGKEFTTNDIAQYLLRGYTPYRYGNIKIESVITKGVRIIRIIKATK